MRCPWALGRHEEQIPVSGDRDQSGDPRLVLLLCQVPRLFQCLGADRPAKHLLSAILYYVDMCPMGLVLPLL
jgi:hypothetical protein